MPAGTDLAGFVYRVWTQYDNHTEGETMKRTLLPFMLAGALSIAAVTPVAAQTECDIDRSGAGGLVAAFVALQACGNDVDILNNSLNNLLRNADIRALNNILNNNDVEITITDVDILSPTQVQVNVLGGGVIIFDTP
jgi:hypothetical protein